ncbi:hypothetical protein [Mucilaginibacter paludis]|uniref:Uncharacterized protein n=1 Tax=Mucilaginibacter paludis DSM 18603 TaxID=714943 RepID=H1YBY8_9SPHI|nr:hypothetical protein [Mucilaginibacter paludis]EHQ27066.1 hypothetical protein Mucpa_2958 [Mucilaginibacter paludis DSM 18603]
MTYDQAKEIHQHLIDELIRNGFSYVDDQINIRLTENRGDEEILNITSRPSRHLFFYIENAIDILENSCANNYDEIVKRFQSNVSGEQITGIDVLLVDGTTFDLSQMPNHKPVIDMLRAVRSELRESSNNNE